MNDFIKYVDSLLIPRRTNTFRIYIGKNLDSAEKLIWKINALLKHDDYLDLYNYTVIHEGYWLESGQFAGRIMK